MSAYYQYQNALSNYDNQVNNYKSAKQQLLDNLNPVNIAREATKDIAPLFIAETGLGGGKAAMNNIRSWYSGNPAGQAINRGVEQVRDAAGRVIDQGVEQAQQAGRGLISGIKARGRSALSRLRQTISDRINPRDLDAEDQAARDMTDPLQRAVNDPGDVPDYLARPADMPANLGGRYLEGQRAYDTKVSNGGGENDAVPEIDDEDAIKQVYGDNGINVSDNAVYAHQAGQSDRALQYQQLRQENDARQPTNPEQEVANNQQTGERPDEPPTEQGGSRSDILSADDRAEATDFMNTRAQQVGRDLEGMDPASSEAKMAQATLSKINRIKSTLGKTPETAEDIAGDTLPARPQIVEDTRAARLTQASTVKEQAQATADNLQAQQDAFERLSGRTVPELDARIATNRAIQGQAQQQMSDIASEPNPNNMAEQAYHNGLDDARVGIDRSNTIADPDALASYTNGINDMKAYNDLDDVHKAVTASNAAEEAGSAGGAAGEEAGLDALGATADALGAETGGLGFLVGGGLALGGELAALFTKPEGSQYVPPTPTFAGIGSSAGLL